MLSWLRTIFVISCLVSAPAQAERASLSLRTSGTIRDNPAWLGLNGMAAQDLQLAFDEEDNDDSKSLGKGTSMSLKLAFPNFPASVASTKPSGCHKGNKRIPDSAVALIFNGQPVGADGLLTFNGDSAQKISMQLKRKKGEKLENRGPILCKDQGNLVITY